MKTAWISYMKKILWRYPENFPQENEAIEKAIADGAPDLVQIAYIKKELSFKEAALELDLPEAEAKQILEGFLLRIGDYMNLPRGA